MKKVTNIIAPLLKTYRYRDKIDPFVEFKKLRKNEKIPESTKGNVLIMPIRVSPISNVFEGLIGYSLRLRGYTVSSLMCGQGIDICENVNKKQSFLLSCSLCNYEQKRFEDTYGIDNLYYMNEITNLEYKELEEISKKAPLSEIFNYIYKNVSIGKYVEGAVSRYLLVSNIDLNLNEKLIRKFFLTSLITVRATKKILKKLKPKFVFSSHGIYSTWGAAVETCKSEGVNVVVWGRGYVGKGSIVASHNNSYLFDAITESPKYWENNEVSAITKMKLDKYFNGKKDFKFKSDYVNYYKNIKKDNIDIFTKLNICKERKRIGVYPNIPWDGKMFSATEEFYDMNVFVRAILEWANKNPSVDLIIRAHPAESYKTSEKSLESFFDLIKMECDDIPSNIIYIEPTSSVSSYDLSEICDAALMYASTLALEFAYNKHPVIQVGLNNVSNKNIVFDAKTKDMMFNYLSEAIEGNLKVDETMFNRVLKYADYWINKKHIPEKVVDLESLIFKSYSFTDSMKLAPNNYETIDWFIDRCEDGEPFIWEMGDSV